MKNHKLKLINVAVLACFGLTAQQAGAATVDISSGGSNNPVKTANEKTGAVTTAAHKITVDTYSGLNTKAANLTVRFDLIGGLKFASAPNIYCKKGASASSTIGISTIVGGNGNSNVTFQVSTGVISAVPTCTLSATYSTTGSQANKSVSATLSYSIGGVTTAKSRSGGFITFNKSLTSKFTPGGAVKVDATKSGLKFVSANSAVLLTASLGKVQFVTGSVFSANGTTKLTAGTTMTTATITVSGPSLAAGFTSVSGNVYLVSAQANCVGGTPKKYTSRSGNTVTFKGLGLEQLNVGYKVCMSVNGKTTITTGALTTALAGTAKTNYAVDTSATSSALTTVETNGSSKNAYFINASNSTNKTSVVRLVNSSGYASNVLTGTVYSEAGAVLGTANTSLGSIASAGQLTLTSADIESKLGITGLAATAKYRLVISSDLTSFKVINFVKDNTTGNITLGQQQDD